MIVMAAHASPSQVRAVVQRVRQLGFTPHVSHGRERTIVGVVGHETDSDLEGLGALEGVERVVRVLHDYPLASRDFHPVDRVIELANGAVLGGGGVLMMAGPCAVEGQEQLEEAAACVAGLGVRVLRGGAFKPRTSPYSFQGLGEEGLRMLRAVADRYGLMVITEVLASADVDLVARYADILQVGARNMQNYRLLQACGAVDRPVVLKRGLAATIDEWLQAAEYILAGGNQQVALCERGIRGFEPTVRFTLDITAIPVLKQLTSLPLVVDPSHAAGRADYVGAIARAAVAAGADGLLVEVHPRPAEALSDGAQSLDPLAFETLVGEVGRIAAAVGRGVA
ncbi:MAG: 3-deoxy-7-phosphoheptulonate synthase [Candidatus Dormibacteria bacterium]